jgi:glycosyltransferase involved in cell wall biosynthesis
MRILFVEPFFTGSHAMWIGGIEEKSRHEISVIHLPGRYWKWRMHGGAITLAGMYSELPKKPDLIVASDMLDLTLFLSLIRNDMYNIPVVLYFHENQITYPWSPDDRDIIHNRDSHYGFINFSSALAADFVIFNSEFHRNSFLDALPGFLNQFPDLNELDKVELIRKKSSVLYLGLPLARYDSMNIPEKKGADLPLILWNHRWEYDKNPGEFFEVLEEIDRMGIGFNLAILGENYRKSPSEFENAKSRYGSRIVKYGYAESFQEYAGWLWMADILPVTSNQDFFGISIAEAVYCRTVPLLPVRLTYPELFPGEKFNGYFYRDREELILKLKETVENYSEIDTDELRSQVSRFDWGNICSTYDDLFQEMVSHSG